MYKIGRKNYTKLNVHLNSGLLVLLTLSVAGCASVSKKSVIEVKNNEELLFAKANFSEAGDVGIAIRYPVGFIMSDNEESDNSLHYQKYAEVQSEHLYSVKGWGKTHSTLKDRSDLIALEDSINYSVDSSLAKTQLVAHALYDNISKINPDTKVYFNPVKIDLSPKTIDESYCDYKKLMSPSQVKSEDTFCFSIVDASFQENTTPASVYIDVLALNMVDMNLYTRGKHRSMGPELTPAITISIFDNYKHTTNEDIQNAYTTIEGTKRQVGDGVPFKCSFTRCKKSLGTIDNGIVNIMGEDGFTNWGKITDSLQEVTDFAYLLAQQNNNLSQHLSNLRDIDGEYIPAVKYTGNKDTALDMLAAEYKYLSGTSKQLHQNFLSESFPKIAELIEAETPVMNELLKETQKAQALEFGSALLGIVAATATSVASGDAGDKTLALSQYTTLTESMMESITSSTNLKKFDISEQLLPSAEFTSNLNYEYDKNNFGLSKQRSLSEVREILRRVP